VKVADLIGRLKHVIDEHLKVCFNPDPKMHFNRSTCTALAELAQIIENNPVNVRPARVCKHRAEVIEVPVKPPTWINRDGEEVIIESMTPAHLQNTIEFVRRVRTERGEAALASLEAERHRRTRQALSREEFWTEEV
jgi:hypothetical protein